MTSSNGSIFRVTVHLCGEFTGLRRIPRTKASDTEFDVFFNLRLIKRLSKHSRGWWFETLSRPLWRHCNGHFNYVKVILLRNYSPRRSCLAHFPARELELRISYWIWVMIRALELVPIYVVYCTVNLIVNFALHLTIHLLYLSVSRKFNALFPNSIPACCRS